MGYTFEELCSAVGHFLGWQHDDVDNPSIWDASKEAEIRRIVKSGLNRFYTPSPVGAVHHVWSFFRVVDDIVAWAAVEVDAAVTVTGTGSGGSTPLTCTGGTPFHPSMVGKSIVITSIGTFTITTYTSSTEITVSGNATCSGKTFSIAADGVYRLPSTFQSMACNELTFQPQTYYAPVQLGGEARIRAMQQTTETTGRPRFGAVRPADYIASTGQRWDLVVFPTPNIDYTLTYRADIRPADLSSGSQIPIGGDVHAETIMAACLAAAERRGNDEGGGVHEQEFQRLLAASITYDARQHSPITLGQHSVAGARTGRAFGDVYVTVNGVLPG